MIDPETICWCLGCLR